MRSLKPRQVRADGKIFSSGQWHSPAAFRRRLVTACLSAARTRAKAEGVPFNLSLDYADGISRDLSHCPILGIPLVRGSEGGRDNSPSFDRIKPELGYVEGNVRCISQAANRLKGAMTLEQVERLVAYMKGTSDA